LNLVLSGLLVKTGLIVTKVRNMEEKMNKEEQEIRAELQLLEAKLQKARTRGYSENWQKLLRRKTTLALRLEQFKDSYGE
jgi:hypothetical protein